MISYVSNFSSLKSYTLIFRKVFYNFSFFLYVHMQAALDRAQHGGDSALRHSDAPTSPSGDKTAAAAALALSPRSAAAIARGAAVALQGARASIFAPMAQQKRALWGTSLKVSRWCCNRAFKVWSLALRKVKHGEASQEAERVRAELEDSWYVYLFGCDADRQTWSCAYMLHSY